MRRVHLDLRLVIAGVLALGAGLAVHALTRPDPTIDAVVAAGPLAPGVRLADLPLTTRTMTAGPGLLASADLPSVADHALIAALDAGDPLLGALLAPPADSGRDIIGLTLDPAHAVQGAVVAGDRVDIYATSDDGTHRLATGVLVLDALAGAGGLGGNDVALLLAVDDDLALALVAAARGGQLDLVRLGR